MSRRSGWVTGCAVLALSACHGLHPVGPDYRRPVLDAPQHLQSADASVFSQQAPVADWWRLYPDPAVQALVQQALHSNLDLRVAAANLSQAQAALAEARSQWLPGTHLNLSASRRRGNVYGSPLLQETSGLISGLSISYELDLFGRIRRTVEQSRASQQAREYAFQATQLQVAASTVQAYALVCQSQAQLDVARHSLGIAQQVLATTQRLVAGGANGALDLTRAQAQVATSAAVIAPLQAQRQGALYSLAVVLGQPPEQSPAVALSCHRPPDVRQVIPVGDGLALLRRRPDVNQAERSLQAASAGIGVATAGLYPTISIGMGFGGAGSTIPAMFEASHRTWNIGPALQWTMPNRRLAHAQIAAAQAGLDASLASYDRTVLNALQETEAALDEYTRALDHRTALRTARAADATALSQAEQLYRHGATAYLDVLTAQQSLASADAQLAQLDGSIAADQIAVFLSLGGGWDQAAQQAAEAAQQQARQAVQQQLGAPKS